jgi:hypothetical protein
MDDQSNSGWKYKPDGAANSAPADDAAQTESVDRQAPGGGTMTWEAPEFIEHHHGASWYLGLVLSTLIIAAIVYFGSGHDIFAAVIVAILGVILGVFASHKPGIAQYDITATGLSVNSKNYRFGDYKSFSIVREGDLTSINLIPLKRFMPPVAAFFEPAHEKKVIEALGEHLPYDDRKMDPVERLSRRLRL